MIVADSHDVSSAIGVVVTNSCRFAVRSGGHGAAPGVSHIQDGITIDLSSIDSVTPEAGNRLVALGPGAEWSKVYRTLAPLGITIPGGTAGGVGAAGSTLGSESLVVR